MLCSCHSAFRAPTVWSHFIIFIQQEMFLSLKKTEHTGQYLLLTGSVTAVAAPVVCVCGLAVPVGVWITPFRAPTIPPMPRALPAPRAPISPATPPSPAGFVPTAATPLSCGWGGLWETEGGVEREEVEPPLLWPPHEALS